MPCLGSALATLNFDKAPFSLAAAAQRLNLSPPFTLSAVVKKAHVVPCHASLFPNYLPRFDPELEVDVPALQALPRTTKLLKGIILPFGMEPALASEINTSRERVLHVLQSVTPTFVDALDDLYSFMARREFKAAQAPLDVLRNIGILTGVSQLIGEREVVLAQHPEPLEVVIFLEDANGEPIQEASAISDYRGLEIDPEGFVLLQDFAIGGREKRFRLALWAGEIEMGLKQFDSAITLFERARDEVLPTDARRRMANLRLALAHAGLADQLYQTDRVLDDETRANAAAHYALAIAAAAQGPADTPQVRAVQGYAQGRLAALEARLNFLGLPNHHLPPNPSFAGNPNVGVTGRLQQFAEALETLKGLRTLWSAYLTAAEDAHAAETEAAKLEQEADGLRGIAKIDAEQALAALEFQNSRAQVVSDRIFLEQLKTYQQILFSIIGVIAGGGGGGFASIGGLTSGPLETRQKLAELDLQLKELALAVGAAAAEAEVSRIRSLVAESNFDFLRRKKAFLDGKRFRADVYYDIALEFERMLERKFDEVNLLAFLAERRAVYELGVLGDRVPTVTFSYPRSDKDMIVDPSVFDDYKEDLVKAVSDNSSFGTNFNLTLSLKNKYPVEFATFLQTGRTFFEISEVDLDREDEGTANKRIDTVRVQIDGIGDIANIRGFLRHHGAFTLRDPVATLSSSSLLPTDSEIAKALSLAAAGKGAVIAAGGLTLWETGPATMNITHEPGAEVIFREFEHYGFSGVWELQLLPEDNPNIVFSTLEDVLIFLKGRGFRPATNTFEDKVRTLLADFQKKVIGLEPLDQTAVFTLAGKFPNAIAQLKSGSTLIDITSELLERNDISLLLVKAFLFRATRQDQQGVPDVRLTISRADGEVLFDKVTGGDGFSDDLNDVDNIPTLPEGERVPFEGLWRLEAPDVSTLTAVTDIACFFVYVS